MTLSDIVIDFEYAKKLKELGVKQESLFWYDPYQNIEKISSCTIEWTSAFTSDELLKMLPCRLQNEYNLKLCPWENGFNIQYEGCDIDGKFIYLEEDSFKLSNALAKMLIYLIENKYIKIEEI